MNKHNFIINIRTFMTRILQCLPPHHSHGRVFFLIIIYTFCQKLSASPGKPRTFRADAAVHSSSDSRWFRVRCSTTVSNKTSAEYRFVSSGFIARDVEAIYTYNNNSLRGRVIINPKPQNK